MLVFLRSFGVLVRLIINITFVMLWLLYTALLPSGGVFVSSFVLFVPLARSFVVRAAYIYMITMTYHAYIICRVELDFPRMSDSVLRPHLIVLGVCLA